MKTPRSIHLGLLALTLFGGGCAAAAEEDAGASEAAATAAKADLPREAALVLATQLNLGTLQRTYDGERDGVKAYEFRLNRESGTWSEATVFVDRGAVIVGLHIDVADTEGTRLEGERLHTLMAFGDGYPDAYWDQDTLVVKTGSANTARASIFFTKAKTECTFNGRSCTGPVPMLFLNDAEPVKPSVFPLVENYWSSLGVIKSKTSNADYGHTFTFRSRSGGANGRVTARIVTANFPGTEVSTLSVIDEAGTPRQVASCTRRMAEGFKIVCTSTNGSR